MDYQVMAEVAGLPAGERAVLATVISTTGSTPRKAGSQILFRMDGTACGTIGGGCSEAQVRQQALGVMESGEPCLVKVNLTSEVAEDNGMICGGTMEVFLERIC